MFTIAFGIVIAVVFLAALPGIVLTLALIVASIAAIPGAIIEMVKGK